MNVWFIDCLCFMAGLFVDCGFAVGWVCVGVEYCDLFCFVCFVLCVLLLIVWFLGWVVIVCLAVSILLLVLIIGVLYVGVLGGLFSVLL